MTRDSAARQDCPKSFSKTEFALRRHPLGSSGQANHSQVRRGKARKFAIGVGVRLLRREIGGACRQSRSILGPAAVGLNANVLESGLRREFQCRGTALEIGAKRTLTVGLVRVLQVAPLLGGGGIRKNQAPISIFDRNGIVPLNDIMFPAWGCMPAVFGILVGSGLAARKTWQRSESSTDRQHGPVAQVASFRFILSGHISLLLSRKTNFPCALDKTCN